MSLANVKQWIWQNKFPVLVFSIFLLLNIFTFGKFIYHSQLDCFFEKVRLETDSVFHYNVKVKSTQRIDGNASIRLVFENGATDTVEWDLNSRSGDFLFKSDIRLEHATIVPAGSVAEKDPANNQMAVNLWSKPTHFFTSYSNPEVDFLTDEMGRIWTVSSGRSGERQKLSVYLTVLQPDGTRVIDNLPLNSPAFYNRNPILRRIHGVTHILWSGYSEETENRILYHTAFVEEDGQLSQVELTPIIHADASLIRAEFVQNDQNSPLIVVQSEAGSHIGFSLYALQQDVESTPLVMVGRLHTSVGAFYTETGMIDDLTLLTDQTGNYLLFWLEKNEHTNIYFSKFTPTGELLVNRKQLSESFASAEGDSLNVLLDHNRLLLFWTYSTHHQRSVYTICYMITDLRGEILQDRTGLIGPSAAPLRDINAVFDDIGNIDLIWADGRTGQAKPVTDLYFQKLTPDMGQLIPPYRLTDSIIAELGAQFERHYGQRYAVWREFDGGYYHTYLKHTNVPPAAVSTPQRTANWSNLIWILANTLAMQLLMLIPMNFWALVTLLGVVGLFSIHKLRNSWMTWAAILQTLLYAQFLSLQNAKDKMGQLTLVSLENCVKISLVTLLATTVIYFFLHKFSRRDYTGVEKRFLFVLIWFFSDTFVLLFVDHLIKFS